MSRSHPTVDTHEEKYESVTLLIFRALAECKKPCALGWMTVPPVLALAFGGRQTGFVTLCEKFAKINKLKVEFAGHWELPLT